MRGSDGRPLRSDGHEVEELEKEATKERKFKRGWKTIRFMSDACSFLRAAPRLGITAVIKR